MIPHCSKREYWTRECNRGKTSLFFLCSKFTGVLNAQPLILRSCGYGVREAAGICTRDATLELDGRYASDVIACFCSGERCNGERCSGGRCNGGSNLQFTYFSLLAVTIHLMYKFISVELLLIRMRSVSMN